MNLNAYVCFAGGPNTDIMESATWDCAVAGTLNNGTQITIVNEKNGWYQIPFKGSTAWIPQARVFLLNLKGYVCFGGGPDTDVMESATWDCAVAGTINNGTQITIINEQNGWYQIPFKGSTAWIPQARVYLTTPDSFVSSYTDIMSEATWDSTVLAALDTGFPLTIINEQNGWYQITFNTSIAWIPIERVSFSIKGYVSFSGYSDTDVMVSPTWDCAVAGTINNGTEVSYFGSQNGWCLISFNGSTAWIPENRFTINNNGCPKFGSVSFSGGSCTDIMKSATWDCAVAGTINNGTQITIIDEQNGWYLFSFNGSMAWIIKERVILPMNAYVSFSGGSYTDIMESATWDCAVAGTLNNGTQITIINEQNGWYQIKFNGSTAWIIQQRVYLYLEGHISFSGYSDTDVMVSPTWDCGVAGTVSSGDQVTIIGEQNGWYQIKFNGSTAWVISNRVYLNVQGSINFSGGYTDIMSEATWNSTVLGILNNGTQITIVGEQSGWYQISFNCSTAWIPTSRVYVPSFYKKSTSTPNGIATNICSANLIYFTKQSEGFAPSRYDDITGTLTDGYGLTGSEISNLPTVILESTATTLLAGHINDKYYSQVLAAIKEGGISNPLQREVDALTDFAYNEGVTALIQQSTVFQKYLEGVNGEDLKPYFMEWDKARVHGQLVTEQGLLTRRILEWNMFCGNNIQIPGYNCTPSISIINTSGQPTGATVTANNGYGANPY